MRDRVRRRILQAIYCYGVNYSTPINRLVSAVSGPLSLTLMSPGALARLSNL